MITYRKAQHTEKKKFKEFAATALRARLYVSKSGWMLSGTLGDIRDDYIKPNDTIVLAFDNGVPIGVCVMQYMYEENDPISSTFIRKSYRRRGIGTKIITKALGGSDKRFYYAIGLQKAQTFFENFSLALQE